MPRVFVRHVGVEDLLQHLQSALASRYSIERELGRGGMAVVYLARDSKLNRAVALKVLRPELAASLGADRFLREIEIAAKLTHPNILGLYDCGDADGQLYYTMPFVEGESLRDRLRREQRLPLEEALRIVQEVADALGHAHSLGVVHRDIKPENILFQGGHALVADFGIARAVTAASGGTLTETGLAVGTPTYMSPEQVVGEKTIDGRSDIYSLGCVLYEMLCGAAPFGGENAQQIAVRRLTDPVPPLRSRGATVPATVHVALERALARHVDQRFATAPDFAKALTGEGRIPLGFRIRRRRRALVFGGFIVIVSAAGWWQVTRGDRAAIRRLAVLPLTSFTNDTSQAYFVEGVHDALISNLQEAGLTVLGRTSVLRYRGTEEPPKQIARELGVDAFVEGTLSRSGDSIEIALRLIDGRTEAVRWHHSYPGEVRSIFALYHGVTRAIAEQVQSALSPQVAARLASARTVDPQAYDDYLRGNYHWQQLTPGDLDAALEYFQRALRRDPTYAPAWAGIAQVWIGRAAVSLVPAREAMPRMRAAVERALALDSSSAVVQYATGLVRGGAEWDWAGAERAFRRAIEINPNYPDARTYYADFLSAQGRFREAQAQIERALELDPLNPLFRGIYGLDLALESRFTDAEREFRRVLQMFPDHPAALMNLWDTLWQLGRYGEAVAILRRLYAGDEAAQDALTQGLAEGGHRAALRRLAVYLGPRQPSPLAGWYVVAAYYALAGERDSAFACLERAYDAPDLGLYYLNHPDFDSLRDDPRFRDLCRRMNLPTCAQ